MKRCDYAKKTSASTSAVMTWAIWVNSGADYPTILDNCVNGVGVLSGAVYASTVARNAAC